MAAAKPVPTTARTTAAEARSMTMQAAAASPPVARASRCPSRPVSRFSRARLLQPGPRAAAHVQIHVHGRTVLPPTIAFDDRSLGRTPEHLCRIDVRAFDHHADAASIVCGREN